jgi:hypothetical protein
MKQVFVLVRKCLISVGGFLKNFLLKDCLTMGLRDFLTRGLLAKKLSAAGA